jgi:hypothetical protein
MPLTTTIQTLTEFRNTVAEQMGFSAYSALSTLQAAHVDKAILFAMDTIALEGNWKWLEREASFTTTAGYNTGTVDLTNLSTGVEGNSTAWDTGTNVLADDKFNAGEGGYYRIASVTDGDTLVLATEFAGTTASAASYNVYRDEYDLADGVLELQSVRLVDPARQLIILSPHDWEEITKGDWCVGEPEYAMLIGSDASEAGNTGTNQRLQMWPLPDATYAYTYKYRTLATVPSSGTSNMEIGPQLSYLLVCKAMEDVYRQSQEPELAASWGEEYGLTLIKAKRSEMSRTKRGKILARGQWGPFNHRWWPRSWPDVTNQ